MIEVISATRRSQTDFWNEVPLGLSLRRLLKDTRLVPRLTFMNQQGLPEVYNARIRAPDSDEFLVFLHDDVWIDDYFIADRVLEGLQRFDVIGVAGNRRRLPNQATWCIVDPMLRKWDSGDNLRGRLAHGSGPFGVVDFYGPVPAECELLDGVFLGARKSVLLAQGVSFDPRFDFHFYDMDFCRIARQKGLRLGTWPISLTHSSYGWDGESQHWVTKYHEYLEKWQG